MSWLWLKSLDMAKSKFHQILSTYKASDPTCDPEMERKGKEKRDNSRMRGYRDRSTMEIYQKLTEGYKLLNLALRICSIICVTRD